MFGKNKSGVMLYFDKENVELLDNFIKSNKRLSNKR